MHDTSPRHEASRMSPKFAVKDSQQCSVLFFSFYSETNKSKAADIFGAYEESSCLLLLSFKLHILI